MTRQEFLQQLQKKYRKILTAELLQVHAYYVVMPIPTYKGLKSLSHGQFALDAQLNDYQVLPWFSLIQVLNINVFCAQILCNSKMYHLYKFDTLMPLDDFCQLPGVTDIREV